MREISAGIIIYRKTPEGPVFLLLYHGHGYWNFPKGKIESEEKALQAALREVREETGLRHNDIFLNRAFRAHERFVFHRQKEKVFKIVIFYLAETKQARITVSDEHTGYGWFAYRDALKILGKYKDSQRVLIQATRFIRPTSRTAPPREPHGKSQS